MSDQLQAFARHYQGRHAPEDALWWLEHPDTAGPTGAAPPQQIFLEAIDELRSQDLHEAADALQTVLTTLMQADRSAAQDALDAAHADTTT